MLTLKIRAVPGTQQIQRTQKVAPLIKEKTKLVLYEKI
jgi:hypothetical protein